MTLYFCVNYGGRAEIADAAQAIAATWRPGSSTRRRSTRRPSRSTCTTRTCRTWTSSCGPRGEQRTSNYLIWQSAYAEMVFQDVLWPDFDRRDLWRACLEYASRDRRFGGALPNEASGRREAAPRPADQAAGIDRSDTDALDSDGSTVTEDRVRRRPRADVERPVRPAQFRLRRRSPRRCRRSPPCGRRSRSRARRRSVSAHFSTAGPSTSTALPQARQTRWWWCPRCSSAGRRTRRRRCAARRPRRRRRGTGGCGRRWSGRPSRRGA